MLTTLIYRSHIRDDEPVKKIEEMVSIVDLPLYFQTPVIT